MMRKHDRTKTKLGGLIAGGAFAAACASAPPPKPPPPPPEPTVAERLSKAKKAYADRQFPTARKEFSAALAKDPKNLEALLLTAASYDLEGQFDDAIDAYRNVLAVDPAHEGALLNLGMVYRRRERFDDAIALYEKALEADPDNVKLRNNLGVVQRLAKKYDDSEKTLRRVLSRAPGNIDAYKNMAVLFLDQNKLALAQQFSVEARKLDEAEERKALPKDSGIWNNLGLIYYKLDEGKPTRAMGAFRKAAELNADDATAHSNIGAIAMRYRDYATAEKSFETAVKLQPNDPDFQLAYAYALDGAHKYKEALAAYQRGTELLGKERCDVAWQVSMLHKGARDWPATYDALTHYKAKGCKDQPAEKLEAELKGAKYMVDHPPAAPAPAQVGQPAAPAPTPAPAPAPEAAPAPAQPPAAPPAEAGTN
jgi:Flp pilus assembly protein TadD